MITAQASKVVGWDAREIHYPTVAEVFEAIKKADDVKLLEWHRFLPSPTNPLQVEIINLVYKHTVN